MVIQGIQVVIKDQVFISLLRKCNEIFTELQTHSQIKGLQKLKTASDE
jgi:hypothetical protein